MPRLQRAHCCDDTEEPREEVLEMPGNVDQQRRLDPRRQRLRVAPRAGVALRELRRRRLRDGR